MNKPVIFFDFTKREVSYISYEQVAQMMRDQAARGVKVSA